MCCQALPTTQATHGLLQGTPTAGIPSYLPLVERTSAGTKPPTPTSTPGPATLYTYRVVNTYPHDPGAFTQGLIYDEGTLYEGTGLRGRSSLRQVELETGQVIRSRQLADVYFGEGITSYSDQIFQLTWQSNVGFVWEEDTFELVQEFSYPTEGWGITHDGHRLIMSDGSATLHFWDPETLEEIGSVQVHDSVQPVERLNELEYIGGEVLANVWLTDRIARIDPETGGITGWVDLSGLLTPSERADADVLNGIAYDAVNDRLFVTGKWWPKLFEIELIPVSATPTT
jgi:glutamine cyclotransferase